MVLKTELAKELEKGPVLGFYRFLTNSLFNQLNWPIRFAFYNSGKDRVNIEKCI